MEIKFNKEKHEYLIDGKKTISVTQLLQSQKIAPSFDGVAESVLEKARAKGNAVHKEVEEFIKENKEPISEEAFSIIDTLKKDKNEHLKSELMVASVNKILQYAGTIDILAENKNKCTLYDIKTSQYFSQQQELSATWQLSLYAKAYEEEYKKKVEKLYILHFLDGKLKKKEVKRIEDEKINELLTAEMLGLQFDQKALMPENLLNLKQIEFFKNYEIEMQKVKAMESDLKQIKDAIYEYMKSKDILKATSIDGSVTITRVRDSEQLSLDSQKIKEDLPLVYDKYVRIIPRKGSLKITFK